MKALHNPCYVLDNKEYYLKTITAKRPRKLNPDFMKRKRIFKVIIVGQ